MPTLEIECDYELDSTEEQELRELLKNEENDLGEQLALRQYVQNMLGYTGLIVQNVGMVNS